MYAVGWWEIKFVTWLHAEEVIPAVDVRCDAVDTLLVHGVWVRSLASLFPEGKIADVIFVILGTPLIGVCEEETLQARNRANSFLFIIIFSYVNTTICNFVCKVKQ